MSITKKFLKSKPVCKVTFKLTPEEANGAKKVELVGDFTEWKENPLQMRKLKDGSFTRTVDLDTGSEYAFRYIADQAQWLDEREADKYIPSPISSADKNSVLVLS